jgi:GNAT superfamily N-acetyltransferase
LASLMLRLARSFRSTLSSLGAGNGLSYLIAQGVLRITRGRVRIVKYFLLIQPLHDGIGLRAGRSRELQVRELNRDDDILHQMNHDEGIIASRFEQGGRCLAAMRKSRLVGYLWWIEGAYCEDEVRSVFVPHPENGAVWDFDVYVAPEDRGTVVFARLWDVASRQLFARGFRRSCSRISAFNTSSLTAHQRLGAEVVGTRWYLCIGSVQLSIAGDAPRLHLSTTNRSRPVVPVPPERDQRRRLV